MKDAVVERALAALKAVCENSLRDQTRMEFDAAPMPDIERCPHCKGRGACECTYCGRFEARIVWVAGDCLTCHANSAKVRIQ